LHQEPHCIDINRIRGAPEGSGTLCILEAAVATSAIVVSEIVGLLRKARVHRSARFHQRFHQLQIGGLLKLNGLRLRETRAWRPLRVDGCIQRIVAACAGQFRIGTALQQQQRYIELPVERGNEQGRSLVAGTRFIDISATVEQSNNGLHVSLTHGMMQGGQPANAAHRSGEAGSGPVGCVCVLVERPVLIRRHIIVDRATVRDGLLHDARRHGSARATATATATATTSASTLSALSATSLIGTGR
jgi:hypothetical protein